MDGKIIKTLGELETIFDSLLLIDDPYIIKLVVGVVIANQLDALDPVWLLLVSAPSSGKTEILQALNDIIDPNTGKPMVYSISDLTINTFASGQVRTGEETSLLFKMPRGGIMSFKDFTSILSKNQEARQEIMGQMREIFDGSYVKRTGNNKDVNWKGKIGALAGSTEIIYEHLESLSAMGDRFAMYSIVQPDRKKALRFIMKGKREGQNKEELRSVVRKATKSYVEHILDNKEKFDLTISDETEDEIVEIADFCTKVRSGVVMDKKYNRVDFVPSKEMPMRLSEQLLALGTAFVVMRKVESDGTCGNDLTENDIAIIKKIGFDSIPVKRRMALKLLATYAKGASTAGLATAIGYETRVVGGWLSQLNGLGICHREKKSGPNGDTWKLKPEYIDMMIKFEHINVIDEELIDETAIEQEEFETHVQTAEELEIEAQFDAL